VTATEVAARMGTTAGETFRDQGTPARNPYEGKSPELAAAWRRAYMTAAKPRSVRRGR
jgi:hypothetical protein